MKISMRYGSHLPVLLKLLSITEGPILELGVGLYSTPLLHFSCLPNARKLVSMESDESWARSFKDSRTSFHELVIVKDWDTQDLGGPWDIVFVDHAPDNRRKIEARRLAHSAQYIVLHDSDPESDYLYNYSEIYPLFKHRFDFTKAKPYTTVLSNFVDLSKFQI